MINRYLLFIFMLAVLSCKNDKKQKPIYEPKQETTVVDSTQLVIAFGSCNNQVAENNLWDDVLAQKPEVWIWGGDVVYSDTDNPEKMKNDYEHQLNQKAYQDFKNRVKVLGTWDDHDYGLNDGGEEFVMKKESEQLFLDFLGVAKDDIRRHQEGVYSSDDIITDEGNVKIIILDTRYFRTALTPSEVKGKRYQPNTYGKGTILGDTQWKWLEEQLKTSTADFNLIVSSIQVMSNLHGFETWGNFPHEVDKLKKMIVDTNAHNVIILSGDRHISEFSEEKVEGLNYPLIDFTSSGLTHTYTSYSGEENPHRVGEVVFDKSFGVLKFNFETKTVTMEMRGNDNKLQQKLVQVY